MRERLEIDRLEREIYLGYAPTSPIPIILDSSSDSRLFGGGSLCSTLCAKSLIAQTTGYAFVNSFEKNEAKE